MNISKDTIIGEIVAEDYRAATVFERFGIDFCFKGNLPLEDACKSRNLSASFVMVELNKSLSESIPGQLDFNAWPLDLLVDYIVKKHHTYRRKGSVNKTISGQTMPGAW